MTTPEPVSDCTPPKSLDWPVTSTVTTLDAIAAAAASGEPLVGLLSICRVSMTGRLAVVDELSSRWATPPPAAPPTTSASASRPAVPGRRDGRETVGAAGGSEGAGGSTAVPPGCDHQGVS